MNFKICGLHLQQFLHHSLRGTKTKNFFILMSFPGTKYLTTRMRQQSTFCVISQLYPLSFRLISWTLRFFEDCIKALHALRITLYPDRAREEGEEEAGPLQEHESFLSFPRSKKDCLLFQLGLDGRAPSVVCCARCAYDWMLVAPGVLESSCLYVCKFGRGLLRWLPCNNTLLSVTSELFSWLVLRSVCSLRYKAAVSRGELYDLVPTISPNFSKFSGRNIYCFIMLMSQFFVTALAYPYDHACSVYLVASILKKFRSIAIFYQMCNCIPL